MISAHLCVMQFILDFKHMLYRHVLEVWRVHVYILEKSVSNKAVPEKVVGEAG